MKTRKLDNWRYEVLVQGKNYEFGKWSVEDSLDALYDITSLVGGPAGQAVAMAFGKGGQGLKTEITGDMANTVFAAFAANMRNHKPVVMALMKKLAGEDIFCEGRLIKFDDHYKDDLALLFAVARAGFEVQFGSFFADALGKLGLTKATQGAPPPAMNPATPT